MAGAFEADLAGLRAEIDRIDAAMHALLMERGRIIDRLIAAKGTAASGSAFRPQREASMMRRLAERHEGRLPFDAVEAIWRTIISTFTHLQAPFSVHGDASVAPMQDSARFHFGFTVPYRPHAGSRAVVAAVAASRGDLGLVPLGRSAEPWWDALDGDGAPKIIARLPFVERPGHPAGTPLLLIAKAGSGEAAAAVRVYSARSDRADALSADGTEVIAFSGSATLLALAADRTGESDGRGLAAVGSYPPPYRLA